MIEDIIYYDIYKIILISFLDYTNSIFYRKTFFEGEKTYKGAENLVLPLLVGIGTVFFFFQIFTLPMIYFKVSQTNLTIIIGGFLLILALVSIVINRPKIKGIKFGRNEGFHVYFYIACAIIIFQS